MILILICKTLKYENHKHRTMVSLYILNIFRKKSVPFSGSTYFVNILKYHCDYHNILFNSESRKYMGKQGYENSFSILLQL